VNRILYFDIDGVLLDYDDHPKPRLLGGALEESLKRAGFNELVCVSGWSEMSHEPLLRIPDNERVRWVYDRFSMLLPDRAWCLERLRLTTDTDHRASTINLNADWYYVDDWADKFFTDAHGKDRYEHWLGTRILLADPFGDGQDIITWLDRIAQQSR